MDNVTKSQLAAPQHGSDHTHVFPEMRHYNGLIERKGEREILDEGIEGSGVQENEVPCLRVDTKRIRSIAIFRCLVYSENCQCRRKAAWLAGNFRPQRLAKDVQGTDTVPD